jgi:hypothetical protein
LDISKINEEEDMDVEYFHGVKDSEYVVVDNFELLPEIPEKTLDISSLNLKPLEIGLNRYDSPERKVDLGDIQSLIDDVDINFDIEVESISDVDE